MGWLCVFGDLILARPSSLERAILGRRRELGIGSRSGVGARSSIRMQSRARHVDDVVQVGLG